MFIFTYSAVILTTICFGIAAFLLLKAGNDVRARFLAGYSLAASLWIVSNAMADVAIAAGPLVFWSGLAMIGASFSVSLYLCFVYSLIHEKRPMFLRLLTYFLPTTVFSIGAFSKYSIVDTLFPPGEPTQIIPGAFYQYLTYFIYGSLIYGSVQLASFYRKKATAEQRQQILYVELGFFLLFFGMLLFALILPILGEYRFFTLGTQFAVFFVVCCSYAILKHRLLDIKLVIQRGVIYSSLLGVIIGVYLAILYSTLLFTEKLTGESYLFASIITTIAGIAGTPSIKRYFKKITDPLFFRDRYVYSEAIDALSKVLNQNLDLDELVVKTAESLKSVLRLSDVMIIVLERGPEKVTGDPAAHDDSESSMARKVEAKVPGELKSILFQCEDYEHQLNALRSESILRLSLVIPTVLNKELVALVGISDKRCGEPFFEDDITLLKSFSLLAAVAIEKARLYRTVKEHSKTLEENVRARTAELRDLQESQAQMMYEISHNLQTPLTIIKGQFDAIKKACGDRKELVMFERSIDKISGFITRLLRLASLGGSEPAKNEATDLSALIEEIIAYFVVMAEQQGIAIEKTIEPKLMVRGDRAQLEELTLNILSNAVKFIAGKKKIAVSLGRKDGGIELRISDTGVGLPESEIPRLFQRFRRGDVAKPSSGSGLGLAICKRIVDLHDGSIGVESTVGKGTTVKITLPPLA